MRKTSEEELYTLLCGKVTTDGFVPLKRIAIWWKEAKQADCITPKAVSYLFRNKWGLTETRRHAPGIEYRLSPAILHQIGLQWPHWNPLRLVHCNPGAQALNHALRLRCRECNTELQSELRLQKGSDIRDLLVAPHRCEPPRSFRG